jgi:hypothetical protein
MSINLGTAINNNYDNTQMTLTSRVAFANSGSNDFISGDLNKLSSLITTLFLNNTGLKLKDTNGSHGLTIAPGSDLTADRTLSVVTADSSRTITLTGDATLADWFDQSVKTTASPTFVTVTAALNGNASSATNATNVAVTNDTTTNAVMYPIFVSASSGNNGAKVSSSGISFTPFGSVLSVSGVINADSRFQSDLFRQGGSNTNLAISNTGSSTSASAIGISSTAGGVTITPAANKDLTITTSGTGKLAAATINSSVLTASQAVFTDGSKNLVSVATTGTGSAVLATSPTLTTPNIGVATGTSLVLSAQPVFIAYLSSDQGNVTGNNATGTVQFNTAPINVGTCFNTGTYTFTAPTTGRYLLTADFGTYGLTAAMNEGSVAFVCTGQTYSQLLGNVGAMRDSSGQLPVSISRIVQLTAGNTCTVSIRMSGGAGNVVAIQSTLQNTQFSAYMLG